MKKRSFSLIVAMILMLQVFGGFSVFASSIPMVDTSKMEAITDTGLTFPTSNSVNVAENVGKVSDFVFTGDFTPTSVGTNGHVSFGLQSTTNEGITDFATDSKANAARIFFNRSSIKMSATDKTEEVTSAVNYVVGTKYNYYISLNSATKTMVAGVKLATSDEWTYAQIELDSVTAGYFAVRPSELFGAWENVTIYVPKVEMPFEDTSKMETITETGLTFPTANSVNVAENVGKVSDFVFTGDFTPTSVGTNGHVSFGLQSTADEGTTTNFATDSKANAARIFFYRSSIKMSATNKTEEVTSAVDYVVGTKYNYYISLNSATKTMVAGVKLATSDEWTYAQIELDSVTAGYFAVRPSELFGAWENVTIYVPKVEMPFEDTSKMETITETGLTFPTANSVNVAENVGKVSDFVFTGDFTPTSVGTNGHVSFGLQSTADEGTTTNFATDSKANAARIFFYRSSIKMSATNKTEEVTSAVDYVVGTKYNYYISLNSATKTMVAGVKLATSDEWTYAQIELDSVTAGYFAVRPSELFGTWENVTIYVPKVEMPFEDTSKMETITETGLTFPTANSVNVAENVGKVSDFVFTGDFTPTSVGTNGHVSFGLQSTADEGTTTNFATDSKANAARIFFYRSSIKMSATDKTEEVTSAVDYVVGTKYNYYISLNSETKTMVAGVKLATSDEWTYAQIELDSVTAGYFAVRPSELFGTWENVTIYVPTDYIFDDEAMYTVNGNKIVASLNVTRNTNASFDTAVLITAVYKISDGMYALDNIKATEEKSLVLGQEVPFTNEVDVPTLAEEESYTVRSFLWHSFDDITPITSAFDMIQ